MGGFGGHLNGYSTFDRRLRKFEKSFVSDPRIGHIVLRRTFDAVETSDSLGSPLTSAISLESDSSAYICALRDRSDAGGGGNIGQRGDDLPGAGVEAGHARDAADAGLDAPFGAVKDIAEILVASIRIGRMPSPITLRLSRSRSRPFSEESARQSTLAPSSFQPFG